MPICFDLTKYMNPVFIETGTHMGNGVKEALKAGFSEIYSIEIDEKRYLNCKKIFKENSNVTIILGDSGKVLPSLLKKINKKITFWIDAHYCADGAFIGDKWCPMKEEFDAIKDHHIKDNTILIDDWRCMENTHTDYSWIEQQKEQNAETVIENKGKQVGFLGKENCLKIIKSINNNYNFSFVNGSVENDVLVCQVN
jgi:hypothetical protein